MNDLISRQEILKHIEKIRQDLQFMDDTHRASITMTGMHLCEEAVMNLPSAQKIGFWKMARCSECGYMDIEEPNYCPNCGTKMEEEV